MGGVFNFTSNLLAHRGGDDFRHTAILTSNTRDRDFRAIETLAADSQLRVEYSSPPENLYSYLRRLRNSMPDGDGVLVCNDWIELAMISAYGTRRTVVNITHADADYYYELARLHEPLIDCFVALTERIQEKLLSLFPHRHSSIFRLPFGVGIPQMRRQAVMGPLRLLYVGRVDRDKGVFDLPSIDRALIDAGHSVRWTIQGSGPDEKELKSSWQTASPIEWRSARPLAEVLPLYMEHDVLVLASKSEGLPVTLLEGGAAGVVPVVSDLPSGIPEIVHHGVNGFRQKIGDVRAFAEAIGKLDSDRSLLESMSLRIRDHVTRNFDATARARDYYSLFARYRELRTPHPNKPRVHYGSRLDKRWIPNILVKALRARTSQPGTT